MIVRYLPSGKYPPTFLFKLFDNYPDPLKRSSKIFLSLVFFLPFLISVNELFSLSFKGIAKIIQLFTFTNAFGKILLFFNYFFSDKVSSFKFFIK